MGEGLKRAFAAAKRTREVKGYRYALWQGGQVVARVECDTDEAARREINHYAAVYGQDGPCKVVRGRCQKPVVEE